MKFRVIGFVIIFLSLSIFVSQGKKKNFLSNSETIISENHDLYDIVYVGKFPDIGENKNSTWFSNLFSFDFPYKNKFTAFLFGNELQNKLRPISVLASSPDSVFFLDQANGVLIRTFGNVGEITHFKGKKNLKFPSLIGCCSFERQEILFTDSRLNQVFKYNPIENSVKYLNNKLVFNNPTGIAYSTENEEIWVVETGAHRIQVLDKNGNFIKYIGTRGKTDGNVNFPTFIWIDDLGIVYVVDTMNFRVQMFDNAGQFLSFFGEPGDSPGSLARPKGIATDNLGNIYVVDALFNNVQVFDKTGKLLTVFGKLGNGNEELWLPVGLFIDKNNYIYVADSYNSRIQIFKLVKNND